MTYQKFRNIRCVLKALPVRVVLLVSLCNVLQACATPSDKLNLYAREKGYTRSTLRISGFELLVYQNQVEWIPRLEESSENPLVLHVYLEGDGTPWRYRTVIMSDPTPRQPLMLRLMSLDKQPSVYIGRPCYNGSSRDPGCTSRLWTSGRYSEQVVASMTDAINVLVKRYKPDQIRLFGHSGGGALAMLIAEQLPKVVQVVTLAGNLDTDAWIEHHGYSPLYSSLNPATRPPLSNKIGQWHLVGERDSIVPPQLVKPFIQSQPTADGFSFSGYDHGCCWMSLWPRVLKTIDAGKPKLLLADHFKTSVSPASISDDQ